MAAVSCGRRPSPLFILFSSLYHCVLMILLHVPGAGSLSFDLTFSQPRRPGVDLSQLVNCTGDAYLSSDTLELTRNRRDQSSTNSIGRAKYVHPVPLWDGATGEMASFTSTFFFRITLDSTTYPGDGMAFFLGHLESDIPRDSGGGSLGLLPRFTNGTGDDTMVAVEFDTYVNPENADISFSHVGIDVNSLNSTASRDATSPTKNLTSGYTMMATVRYGNVTKLLGVELDINGTSYAVSATVDLRSYLPEQVAVGFSAATGIGGEQHQVFSWSFASTLEPRRTTAATIAPAPPPLTTDTTSKHPKQRAAAAVVLVSVLVPVLLVLAGVGFLVWRKRKGRRRSRVPAGSGCEEEEEEQEQDDMESRADLERGVAACGPRRYSYRELAAATNNFADDGKLGRGGFGSVYRGNLITGTSGVAVAVAIKVFSSESSAQGRKEFEAEVRIISRLKHRNLVQLLGWCDSRSGLLLVYELVADGSLDKHLYSRERLLTWAERYHIILGLGSALRYLHHEWDQRVVHGDIKPSNIMLDKSHGAKLGVFGLARLGDHGAKWHTTKAVLGTAGYIDPEFVNTRQPSTHSDVYSFGIVLLEMVSRRAPVVILPGEEEEGGGGGGSGGPPFLLLKWVWGLYGRNATLDAADERLRGDEADDRCMERVLVVGLWCAHPEQSQRPSMAQAMQVLQSEDATLPALPPQMYRPVLSDFDDGGALSVEFQSYYSGTDSSSTNTGQSKISSSASSSTALLRDSKERS